MLRAADAGALSAWNERARADREALLGAGVAGGPLHELRVSVPNRPGVIAEIALTLGRAGVNIVDMALSPSADNRQGVVALWVRGAENVQRAQELIAERRLPGGARVNLRFEPSGPLTGELTAPADKSISHRAALLGAMASYPVRIENYLHAADTDLDAERRARARRAGRGAPERGRRARHRPARGARARRRRSTSATPARCCACCPAGSPRRRAARSRSTATSRSAAARWTAWSSRCALMGADAAGDARAASRR